MKKILVILTCLIFLVGCSNNKDTSEDKEKVGAEIEYFSKQIAEMFNNLNNISLENYELISKKVSMSDSSSSGGDSQSSSNQSSSKSSGGSGEQSGGESSGESGGEDNKDITITSMEHSSILTKNIDDIDWNTIKSQIENINTSWSIAMLDLYNSNVSNEDIMAFGNTLDQTILSIKNENKIETLNNLGSLYSYIPKFLQSTSNEKNKQNIETTKYHIFIAYSAASQDDWNTVATNLANAETNFLNVLNNTEYSKNKEFKTNKTYMLIKELQNSVAKRDKQLFFLKYINLMENMNTL